MADPLLERLESAGAHAALRGYRRQFLYTLSRIVTEPEGQEKVFQLERYEDLEIISKEGRPLEYIQIKDYSEDLTVSALSIPFFRRAVALLKGNQNAVVKVVSFGPFGPELSAAWSDEDSADRRRVRGKLQERGFTPDELDTVFRSIKMQQVDETVIETEVYGWLSESALGGDPEHAFKLLHSWLYGLSEQGERVIYADVVTTLNRVGTYLRERAAHHEEWYRTIRPLERHTPSEDERAALAAQFYEGVSARYEHILASVDVPRESKLADLEEAFQASRVVIVHGASGQGKSALAYRYLNSKLEPGCWCFEAQSLSGLERVQSVAVALAGHLKVVKARLYVYVDVQPGNTYWPELVRQLSHHQDIYILMTIREEDLKRTNVPVTDLLLARTVPLSFDEAEASEIYDRLAQRRPPERFLGFTEAWARFGGQGPLLEFVHLVTQNESLRERLEKQVNDYKDRVNAGTFPSDGLELLRRVAVASAYGSRLSLKALVRDLSIPAPDRVVGIYESEYLLRQSEDRSFVEGLHPIRSQILADLLTDEAFHPWVDTARSCLGSMLEADIEAFLLSSFYHHQTEQQTLLRTLFEEWRPQTWVGFAGALRSLLWLGVFQYAARNRAVINAALEQVGAGLQVMLDTDLTDVSAGKDAPDFEDMDFLPEGLKNAIKTAKAQQSLKGEALKHARDWLERAVPPSAAPQTEADWSGAAEVAFWSGYLGSSNGPMAEELISQLNAALERLSINTLANVVFALSYTKHPDFFVWLQGARTTLLNRFCVETESIHVEDDGSTLRIHFVPGGLASIQTDGNQQLEGGEGFLNREAVRRAETLRKLVPDRQFYATHGYGHKPLLLESPADDTVKNMPTTYMYPRWAVNLNAVFSRLGLYPHRPDTWEDYARQIYVLRKGLLISLVAFNGGLNTYFRKATPFNILTHVGATAWNACARSLNRYPSLPKSAVDELGFTGEGYDDRQQNDSTNSGLVREIALLLKEHEPFLKALRNYLSPMSNFYAQAPDVIAVKGALGKATPEGRRKILRSVEQEHTDMRTEPRFPTLEFTEALEALGPFQQAFRERFAAYFQPRELEELEAQERKVLFEAWSLWLQLAFHPNRRLKNPAEEAVERVESLLRRVRRNFEKRLDALEREGIVARALPCDLKWEGQPALWISYDVQDPSEIKVGRDAVLTAFKASIAEFFSAEIAEFVVRQLGARILLIPLFKGKALTTAVWQTSTDVLLQGSTYEGQDWWNYVPHPVPPEVWEVLDVPVWEHSEVQLLNELQVEFSKVALLSAFLVQLYAAPRTGGVSVELAQRYVEESISHIRESIQAIINKLQSASLFLRGLEEATLLQRGNSVQAFEAFGQALETILQAEETEEVSPLLLWQNVISALTEAEAARRLWLSDIGT